MEPLNVSSPHIGIIYNGKNITEDLEPLVISATYTSVIEDSSDTISLTLENTKRLWLNQWYPYPGSTLDIEIGYKTGKQVKCGSFQIDNVAFGSQPATVTLKALATGLQKPHRTHNGKSFENTTLKLIAEEIAGLNGLKLIGEIEEIPIRRITQIYEKDLSFLKRIADEFGYGFTIKSNYLSFIKREIIRKATPDFTIDMANDPTIKSWTFNERIKDIVKSATVSYHDPLNREVIDAKADYEVENTVSADELKLNIRCEDENQAEKKAKAAIERQNEDKANGTLNLIGNAELVSGRTLYLSNIGKFSGKWWIKTATHDISKSSGFTTALTISKVLEDE